MTATHYADRDQPPLVLALCGRLPTPQHATRDHDAVTCRDCLRRLAECPVAPSELTEAEPWTPPPPKPMAVKGSRWGDMPARIRRLAEQGTRRAQRRPKWGSPEEAARFVAQCRADGYPSGSAAQGWEQLGKLGTRPQTSGRGSSKGSRLVENSADVELAIDAARYWVSLPDGVTYATAVTVWAEHKVGRAIAVQSWEGRKRGVEHQAVADDAATVAARHGLTASDVVALSVEVHRALLLEMATRNLCPTPARYRAQVEAEREARGWVR